MHEVAPPTVSIIMPTFSQAAFLPAAILSIQDQRFRDWELIIVDDGSTDETAQILDPDTPDPRIRVVTLPHNGGTANAINRGARHARGKWMTWVSSDNIMRPGWLWRLLRDILSMWKGGVSIGAAYSGFSYCPEVGKEIYIHTEYEPGKLIEVPDNCFFGPAFLIRADIWQPHRGAISHDYDNWLRVEEACWDSGLEILSVDSNLCVYNAHSGRATVTRRDEYDAPHWQQEARERRGIVA